MAVRVTGDRLAAIGAHAEACWPDECCGLLVGRRDGRGGAEVVRVEATGNRAAGGAAKGAGGGAPIGARYRVPPRELWGAIARARREGLDLVGFYHSHPSGRAVPSRLDRVRAWRGAAYIIIEVKGGRAGEARAWTLPEQRDEFEPLPLAVGNGRERRSIEP